MLKNGFRICPRIDDLGPILTSVSPLDRRLTDFLLLSPVGFSFLSGLSFHLVEFLHQHAFVIELMYMGRTENHRLKGGGFLSV